MHGRSMIIFCAAWVRTKQTYVESHICILQTALDLRKHGCKVHIPHDAISATRAEQTPLALQARCRLTHIYRHCEMQECIYPVRTRFCTKYYVCTYTPYTRQYISPQVWLHHVVDGTYAFASQEGAGTAPYRTGPLHTEQDYVRQRKARPPRHPVLV